MKITVSEIKEQGIDLDFTERLHPKDLLEAVGPVDAHLRIERRNEEVLVNGSIHGRVTLRCSRCLADFEQDLSIDIDLRYHPVGDLEKEEAYEVPKDEINIGFYSDDEIDVTQIVREQLILSLPMKPLCDERCKGLCPVCGADINVETCGCKDEAIDPRLESLKRLFSNRKE